MSASAAACRTLGDELSIPLQMADFRLPKPFELLKIFEPIESDWRHTSAQQVLYRSTPHSEDTSKCLCNIFINASSQSS